MRFIADLHIHSRYSRATSSDLTPENLWRWAQYKGIHVVGVGDCVHPAWLKELEEKLEPAESGFFKLKEKFAAAVKDQVPATCQAPVRFVLSTEISNIYKKNGIVRKVHNVILLSGFEAARALQKRLDAIGNIRSDGRPILGLDAKELLAISLACDPQALFIPAHIWTPWFSVLGSKSGFDSIEECFEELTPHIHALETGLSSDPAMNRRLKQLDRFALVSNSDAHSASKLGREANIFDTELSYEGMYRALADNNGKTFCGTIEFFPEEGKYHADGCAKCKLRLEPRETIKHKGRCPSCGGLITVGVMARVEALADRCPPSSRSFKSLIPLEEVLAESCGVGKASKKVQAQYFDMIAKLGPELGILMDVPLKDIQAAGGDRVAEGIKRMRTGQVSIAAGYDGEYGVIKIFNDDESNVGVRV
ncbi:MAG: DNA helicase UvrD [Candidatus Omnitrophica bacterium]|nr:DNA helicase UvrD [Candidatus Omnitrophota bacterium]